MPQNPPEGLSRVTPYLLYEDVDAMVDWLVDVCGFAEHVRMPGAEGTTVHAEVKYKDGTVMMGYPGPDYQNPKRRGGATQLVSVYVDDVDDHCKTATAKGATIVREIADQFYGDRTYGVEDPEGHHWMFGQHV